MGGKHRGDVHKLNTAYRPVDTAAEPVAKMKVIKEESKVLGILMIDNDLFTCDTPLGSIFVEFNQLSIMDDDLFTYEVKIPKLSYFLSVEQQINDLDYGDLDIYKGKCVMMNYTKSALWIYWTRSDDEEVITNDELLNPKDGDLVEEAEIAKIFKIETDIFDFETTLCKAYEEHKNTWIYEWNKHVPRVANMPWLDYGLWMEPSDDIEHVYLLRVIQTGDMIYFKNFKWYENLKYGKLKDEALNCNANFEGSKGVDEESSNDPRIHCLTINEWEDFDRANNIRADANSNYEPYLDVFRKFNDHAGKNNYDETQEKEGWFDEHELMEDDDEDIGDIEDYLIHKEPLYYVNEDEERSKERRCKLLGIPYVKLPTCKSEKFEVVDTAYPNSMDMAY
nr:hypothetical protein [Tanacetum cinerariifolium]